VYSLLTLQYLCPGGWTGTGPSFWPAVLQKIWLGAQVEVGTAESYWVQADWSMWLRSPPIGAHVNATHSPLASHALLQSSMVSMAYRSPQPWRPQPGMSALISPTCSVPSGHVRAVGVAASSSLAAAVAQTA